MTTISGSNMFAKYWKKKIRVKIKLTAGSPALLRHLPQPAHHAQSSRISMPHWWNAGPSRCGSQGHNSSRASSGYKVNMPSSDRIKYLTEVTGHSSGWTPDRWTHQRRRDRSEKDPAAQNQTTLLWKCKQCFQWRKFWEPRCVCNQTVWRRRLLTSKCYVSPTGIN